MQDTYLLWLTCFAMQLWRSFRLSPLFICCNYSLSDCCALVVAFTNSLLVVCRFDIVRSSTALFHLKEQATKEEEEEGNIQGKTKQNKQKTKNKTKTKQNKKQITTRKQYPKTTTTQEQKQQEQRQQQQHQQQNHIILKGLGIILESAPIEIFCFVAETRGQMFRRIPGIYSTSGAVVYTAVTFSPKCEFFTASGRLVGN